METADIMKTLEESLLFGDLKDEERGRIARFSNEAVFEAGDILFHEGDPAEKIYIVVKGTVAVEVGLLGRRRRRCATIATAGRGESVGWSAGIGSPSYLSSAYAVEKTTALAIDRQAVRLLCTEEPSSGLLVMKKLADLASSRLSRTAGVLANMLSTASHDLKAHLAAVESLNQVVLGGYAGDLNEQQKKFLTRAGERVKGLVSILDEIFVTPHVEPCVLQTELVPLEEIVCDSLIKAGPMAAGKRIELKADWFGKLPLIPGDRARLKQAFDNLVGNAVKFTQNGGKVNIRITDDDERRQTIVEIIDNGPGIDAGEIARIFDDFYRGKDAPIDGAGLGLSNARRIIEAHGGRIWAESPCRGSKGAKFTFTLPRLKRGGIGDEIGN